MSYCMEEGKERGREKCHVSLRLSFISHLTFSLSFFIFLFYSSRLHSSIFFVSSILLSSLTIFSVFPFQFFHSLYFLSLSCIFYFSPSYFFLLILPETYNITYTSIHKYIKKYLDLRYIKNSPVKFVSFFLLSTEAQKYSQHFGFPFPGKLCVLSFQKSSNTSIKKRESYTSPKALHSNCSLGMKCL